MENINIKPFYKSRIFAAFTTLIVLIILSSLTLVGVLMVVTSPNYKAGVAASDSSLESKQDSGLNTNDTITPSPTPQPNSQSLKLLN